MADRHVRRPIAWMGPAYPFHASADGGEWQLVRDFALEADGTSPVGFLAQPPTGEGCEVTVSELRFAVERSADIRRGI